MIARLARVTRGRRPADGPPAARVAAPTGTARAVPRPLWPADHRARRSTSLLAGLLLYGFSDALLLLAGLGVDPWDVLHQGLSRRLGLAVGTWSIIIGAAVLLLWIPLRQRPGIGTLTNVVLVGGTVDATMAWTPAPHAVWLRWTVLLAGILLNGVATGCYIGAGMGPGPRDGLMTGLAARGHSVRVVRTGIELSVLLVGWLLGGDVGWGTLCYAVAIGPLAHVFMPLLAIGNTRATAAMAEAETVSP